ncbi:efflux RND transporter periplasmic adaptor subunit [Primorskyibacter aestuariivivens]|uniref:efflux RND transporter periplasmic adaptor subunit n=1 Tax=Primorskyibacter aestuariivivens TaxID=1888912 RepID=UPI0023015CD9|nr:efflux RND transporter periplasmic adaptor subunit [Primorskyibacter aestuariivivens]MDA7428623.1 efflux RND transporter periplasmic adaptor subunit [Primorskyibacter aestuariivivens]
MRLIPILLAVAVTAFIAFAILERDRLLEFAQLDHLGLLTGEEESGDDAPAEDVAEAEETEADAPETGVRVVALRSVAQVVDSAVLLRGETEAARQVSVMAETSGLVISEPLRKGAFVEEGEELCELDPGTRSATLDEMRARLAEARAQVPTTEARIPEAEARLEEARARLEEAVINANAATKLQEDGFASETRVASTAAAVRAAEAAVSSAEAGVKAARSGMESTQAAIQSAQAAVAGAEKEIERLRAVAPFAGLLESDTAELGTLMQPGALCATIIQLDPIKLVGFVPETEVSRVEVGARAGARLSEGSDVIGRVTFLSRSADETTRTFRVEIEVPNPDLAIRDGQTAEILIEADGVTAHLLPQSSLTLNDEGVLGVRTVAEGNSVAFIPVELLRDTREGVWVAGLPDNVDVITLGQEYVVDGVKVIPSFRDSADTAEEATQ